ncbi:MAG: hypothetical protein ABIR16_01995, partial [Dokdonella sp.]
MSNKFLSMSFTVAVALLAIPGKSSAGLYNIDTTFSNSGRFNWTTPGSDFRLLAHLAMPGGRSIAITTYDNNGCPTGRHCFALYPYNVSGQGEAVITLPTNLSFSKRTGGVVLDPYLVKAAAVDSQGRIVIAGTEQFGTVFQFKAIRLLPTGQVDASFGIGGVATPGSFTAQNLDIAEAVAIDGSDRVVIAGSAKFT